MRKSSLLVVIAAAGVLALAAVAYAANITGTNGPDTLIGTAQKDTINGLAGDDNIAGLNGDDTIDSGAGNDIVNGDGACPPGTTDLQY